VHGGHGQLQGAGLLGGEVQAQLVAAAVDAVAGGTGPITAQHLGLDGHAAVAQRCLVPLERTAPGRLAGGVLAGEGVGDLLERQRLARLQQEGHQVGEPLQRVGHRRA
jgi:hypothetical protein